MKRFVVLVSLLMFILFYPNILTAQVTEKPAVAAAIPDSIYFNPPPGCTCDGVLCPGCFHFYLDEEEEKQLGSRVNQNTEEKFTQETQQLPATGISPFFLWFLGLIFIIFGIFYRRINFY